MGCAFFKQTIAGRYWSKIDLPIGRTDAKKGAWCLGQTRSALIVLSQTAPAVLPSRQACQCIASGARTPISLDSVP
jgi:hypothetical protein